jgi:hypothetical protein
LNDPASHYLTGYFSPGPVSQDTLTFLQRAGKSESAPSNHTLAALHRIKRWNVFDWKSEKDVCRQKAHNNPQNATILPIVRL